MTNAQKSKNNNTGLRSSGAFRDLALVITITIIVIILSYFFDVFVIIVKFLQKYPNNIVYIDEVITALLTLSIGFAIFSWRRWMELKKETAERIKLEEELIRIANTNAEVERIISKQLRCEIELRRQKEKDVSFPKLKVKKQPK